MRLSWIRFVWPILLLVSLPAAATDEEVPMGVQRLSDRVLVLSEDIMDNNIVAVASAKGLVVFDTSGSPTVAARAREIIVEEFGRDDFAYVVNTHHHWDHSFGNCVFPEAEIVGYERSPIGIERNADSLPRRIANIRRNVAEAESTLTVIDQTSEEADDLRQRLAQRRRRLRAYTGDMTFPPPTITFSDRMVMDLGDLTLKMYFFGRAHSGTDIFIVIPEEGMLLTGDIFLDRRWLPLFAGLQELDIPRWIEVLGLVLDGEDEITRVIPAHLEFWTPEKLDMWRDYIVNLWETLQAADAAGEDLETARQALPLEEKFYYLRENEHDDARIEEFHADNIRAFWRQLKESAAEEIERVLTESGVDAARERFGQLRADSQHDYLFDEGSFNALGYRLMGDERIDDAITVFEMNVELFPEAWNVYDSLAEAYMNHGDRELAIENYRRSIEINPENTYGMEMLRQLVGE